MSFAEENQGSAQVRPVAGAVASELATPAVSRSECFALIGIRAQAIADAAHVAYWTMSGDQDTHRYQTELMLSEIERLKAECAKFALTTHQPPVAAKTDEEAWF